MRSFDYPRPADRTWPSDIETRPDGTSLTRFTPPAPGLFADPRFCGRSKCRRRIRLNARDHEMRGGGKRAYASARAASQMMRTQAS